MPGRNLSGDEKALLDFWEAPPRGVERPLLRAIEISGGEGLRGLDGLLIPFSYPITALCGKNGTGKSTVLALAALAYHSPAGWNVHWTNTRYRAARRADGNSYYIFPDFFFYGASDHVPNGVQITWRHMIAGAEQSTTFTKTARQWGSYSRRPAREVDYVPLSRVIPAHEMNAIRGAFQAPGDTVGRQALNQMYRRYLSFIMGANYEAAEILRTDRLTFSECRTAFPYTAFNMGGGEGCIIHILYLMQSLPPFGLLVVEEIESCLHPEAQIRLAHVLVQVCREKKLQIICSTHSENFLDALPRQARVLIRKDGGQASVLENPSTRFAVYEMSGSVQPELTIYCEDKVAAMMIEETVPYGDRIRLRIVDVGNATTVIRQGVVISEVALPAAAFAS